MDLRTYPTQRMYEAPPMLCTICMEPSDEGYIDMGPADILCIPCARRAASALGDVTKTSDDAQTVEHACPTCSRTFTRAAALGSHARTHLVTA